LFFELSDLFLVRKKGLKITEWLYVYVDHFKSIKHIEIMAGLQGRRRMQNPGFDSWIFYL